MGACAAKSTNAGGGIKVPTNRVVGEGRLNEGVASRSAPGGKPNRQMSNQSSGSWDSSQTDPVGGKVNESRLGTEERKQRAANGLGGHGGSSSSSSSSSSSNSTSPHQQLMHMTSSKLEEHSRRRLSVSTVQAAPENWERGVVGTTHVPLIHSLSGAPSPSSGAHTVTPPYTLNTGKRQTAPRRSIIKKFTDPALQLVDERRGAIREVTLRMILDLVPDAGSYFACFGAPSYESQNGYDNKVTELVASSKNAKFSEFGIGYACKKGLKPESPNQDDFMLLKVDDWAIYGVFDGHGPCGHEVSNFVHTTLPFLIISDPQFETDTPATLRRAFRKVHHLLEAAAEQTDVYLDCTLSGSTGTVVVQRDNKLYVAHVGDSRCVLAQKKEGEVVAVNLTIDHKPTIDAEKARIEAHGGEVRRLEGDIPHRVFVKNRMYPGLAMSRAIGDSVGTAVGVISDPDIRVVNIQKDDEFFVVCSDGVWEFISCQESVDFCSKMSRRGVQEAAESLASESWTRWVEEEENVVDDITCIITWLH